MSDIVDRITAVLRDHTWGIYRDDAGIAHSGCMCKIGVNRDHPAHVAAAVAAELNIPDRKFTDDLGRRWEWCGGVPGTWAWRVTGNQIAFHREKRTFRKSGGHPIRDRVWKRRWVSAYEETKEEK